MLGRLDEALSLCLEASLNYPTFTDIFYLGGLLLEEKEEYHIALKWFKQAINCGTPPALFSHQTGSGSFLSHYHLGFCYERIGNSTAARGAYESALELNPKYPYPLYSLFLNLRNEKGPCFCFQHLEEQGFLQDLLLCITTADLFFLSDHVDLAYRCLEIHKGVVHDDERFLYFYGKYCIYSGRATAGLEALTKINRQSSYYPPGQILSLVALIHLGDFFKAESLAVTLWKSVSTRCEATVFLSLIRFMQKHTIPPCQNKVRGKETLSFIHELFLDCKRYRSNIDKNFNPLVNTWYQGLEILMKSSERGFDLMLKDFTQQIQDYNNCFAAKFKNGWVNDEY
jgi:Tfp pilus assembly protein PilF